MKTLTFWFEFASTYSYLSAMRIEEMCRDAGVALEWRPFLLGPIFAAQGWTDSPFNLYPAKGRYMWDDMAREADRLGLEWRKPTIFPQNGLLAARVVSGLADHPDVGEVVRGIYCANFVKGQDISDPQVLRDVLETAGIAADTALEAASQDAIKQRLRENTEAAQAAGIFGAPSFTVGEALFWGNDRLEAALAHAAPD